MVHPTIRNLVLQKQAVDKYQWVTLLIVLLVGLVTISIGSSLNWGVEQKPIFSADLSLPSPVPHDIIQTTAQGFIQTSGGVKNLQPFGKFTIVKDYFDVDPSKAAFTIIHASPIDYMSGDHLPALGVKTNDMGDGFGLPPIRVNPKPYLKLNQISSVGQPRTPEYKESRLPQGSFPQIVLQESSTSPSFRFIPDSAFVRGWLHFQTNGWLRFEPLPGKHPDVSDRLQEYLTDAVVKAYGRTKCHPAIVNGQPVERKFVLGVYFSNGEGHVWSDPSQVVMGNL